MTITERDGTTTIFYDNPRREINLSVEEYDELKHLIKNPPPKIEIKEPLKMWSPCQGEGCGHSSHKKLSSPPTNQEGSREGA